MAMVNGNKRVNEKKNSNLYDIILNDFFALKSE